MIFISDEAENFGGIQHFCLIEKFGHFTFYGGKYINLVKYEHSTRKILYNCVISGLYSEQYVNIGPRVKIQNCDIHQ